MEYAIRSKVTEIPLPPPSALLADVGELLRAHRARILRFVMLSVNDMDVAESITQDAFLKAYQSRESFRGDCSVSTWLTRIAYHLICDYTRLERYKFWKRVGQTSVEASSLAGVLPSGERSAEQQILAQERLAGVLKAVELLPLKQRSIFTLHFVEELSVAEIAAAMDLRSATVKTHLYRAIAKVRTAMEGQS